MPRKGKKDYERTGPLRDFLASRPSPSSDETKAKLVEYRKNPTIDLRNEIVEDNLRLVLKYASECARDWHCPIQDLFQEGSLALIKAVDDFDPARNTTFSTLATTYIKNAIFQYLGKYGKTIRIPTALSSRMRKIEKVRETLTHALGREPTDHEIIAALKDGTTTDDLARFRLYSNKILSLDMDGEGEEGKPLTIADPDADPHAFSMDNDRYDALLKAFSTLDEKDRDILLSRHCDNPLTLSELGKKYGVSPEAIRQREAKAIKTLKEKLEAY